MKAIVLCGGAGKRMGKLTESIPKPMLSIAGRPVLEHIINLLAKNGFDDIALAMHYKPEVIINYFCITKNGSDYLTPFGHVCLSYKVETTPRGTAGAVKDIMDSASSEDFLVLPGDALTDFDLGGVMRQHIDKKSDVTIALSVCDTPTEYGTAVLDESGRIISFIEKPAWENVVTNLVNTGIYMINPHIMDKVPAEGQFDFAFDLFPELKKSGAKMYGVSGQGYWLDIGSPESYSKADSDALSGAVKLYTGERRGTHPAALSAQSTAAGFDFSKPGLITGIPGRTLKYETILCLGQSLAQFGTVGISYSGANLARTVSAIISSGVNTAGSDSVITDASVISAAAYASELFGLSLSVFVSQRGESVRLHILGKNGCPIPVPMERKIRLTSLNPKTTALPGSERRADRIEDSYITWVREYAGYTSPCLRLSVAGYNSSSNLLRRVLGITAPARHACADDPHVTGTSRKGTKHNDQAAFVPSADGDSLEIITESGLRVDRSHTLSLGALIALRRGAAVLRLPSDMPSTVLRMIESLGRSIIRTDSESEVWTHDGILLAAMIASYVNDYGFTLDAVLKDIPQYSTVMREIHINGSRAAVMRALTVSADVEFAEELGVYLTTADGSARITPVRTGETLLVKAEAQSDNDCELIASRAAEVIANADKAIMR